MTSIYAISRYSVSISHLAHRAWKLIDHSSSLIDETNDPASNLVVPADVAVPISNFNSFCVPSSIKQNKSVPNSQHHRVPLNETAEHMNGSLYFPNI